MDTKYKNQNQNQNQKMDLYMALDLLDIDQKIPCINLTHEYVKRKYHKMALKCHPDKNGNTIEATQRFQRITEAYNYLITELELKPEFNQDQDQDENKDDTKDNNHDSQLYTSLLSMFLVGILKVDTNTTVSYTHLTLPTKRIV